MQPVELIDLWCKRRESELLQTSVFEKEIFDMILADKIINERKKNGWSQEELADKLSVSRQSVSKWEGAQSVPDLNRIVQMAELFM